MLKIYIKIILLIANINFIDCRRHQNVVHSMKPDNATETKKFEQPLNHFDSKDNRRWNMSYLENLKFWKPNGPLYINIGGAYPLDLQFPAFSQDGFLYNISKETHGAMFGTEFRYFGSDDNFFIVNETAQLKYMSTAQLLGDIESFIKFVKSMDNAKDSKVVLLGGEWLGVPGNLATWMRLKFPDIVDAAVAVSAPLLAKANYIELLEIVSEDIKKYGTEGCYDKIEEWFKNFKKLLSTPEGIEELKRERGICDFVDMSVEENQQVFYEFNIESFELLAYYAENETVVKNFCRKNFKLNSEDFVLSDHSRWCYNFDFNQTFKNTRKDPWLYLQCTEYGQFVTTDSTNPLMFPKTLPIEYFYKVCETQFGPGYGKDSVERGVKATNEIYGGLKPNVTKVVFVTGNMDPYQKLAVTSDLNADAPAITIPGTSGFYFLESESKEQSAQMVDARRKVIDLVKKWIGL